MQEKKAFHYVRNIGPCWEGAGAVRQPKCRWKGKAALWEGIPEGNRAAKITYRFIKC